MGDDEGELRRLEQQLRALVKERTDLESRLANPEMLRTAAARAYRDRDAVTSPLLEEARGRVAADIEALHEQWREPDRIARRVERLEMVLDADAPEHIRSYRDAILAGLPEVRRVRAGIAATLAQAGLEGILPEEARGDGEG